MPPPVQAYEPRRRNTGLIVTIVVIGLLVLGGGAVAVFLLTKDKSAATATSSTSVTGATSGRTKAGVCVKVSSLADENVDVTHLDCGSPEAAYKVAVTLDNSDAECPGEDYDRVIETGVGDGSALCLMLNAKEGDCFQNLISFSKGAERVDCGSSSAEFKVVKVVDGQANASVCPTGDTVLPTVYPEPPNTICLDAAI
jgi:hypothetical protein